MLLVYQRTKRWNNLCYHIVLWFSRKLDVKPNLALLWNSVPTCLVSLPHYPCTPLQSAFSILLILTLLTDLGISLCLSKVETCNWSPLCDSSHSLPYLILLQDWDALSPAEMKLIFLTAALTVLCFGLVATEVLITHQCLASAVQHWHSTSMVFPIYISRLGVSKILEENTKLTWTDQRVVCFMPYHISSDKKAKKRRIKVGHLVFTVFVFRSNHCPVMMPCFLEVLDITCQ